MFKKSRQENGNPYIRLTNVSLWYERSARLTILADKHFRKKKMFRAIDNVSILISENETIGIIGRNGSGKSSISRLMCNVLEPNQGKVDINGKVQLLALGVGFKTTLTGRDNVYISGALLGLSRKEILSKIDDIEDFAELGEYFDEPVRTYSSGMKSRLGFAVSTVVQPDILILDEVLSTGDQSFKNKAEERMEDMRSRTKIVIVVSHNPSQIQKMCTRVIWLEKGRVLMDGEPEGILEHYRCFCSSPKDWISENPDLYCIPA